MEIKITGLSPYHQYANKIGTFQKKENKNENEVYENVCPKSNTSLWWFKKRKQWIIGLNKDVGQDIGLLCMVQPLGPCLPMNGNGTWWIYEDGTWKIAEQVHSQIIKQTKKLDGIEMNIIDLLYCNKRNVESIAKKLGFKCDLIQTYIDSKKDKMVTRVYNFSFVSKSINPWGNTMNLGCHWSNWKIMKIVPGKQTEQLGIKVGDKLIAIDGAEMNENNHFFLKEKLLRGEACKQTFLRSEAYFTSLNPIFGKKNNGEWNGRNEKESHRGKEKS